MRRLCIWKRPASTGRDRLQFLRPVRAIIMTGCPDGGWFFDGFTPHDAAERCAIIFGADGNIQAVALLNGESGDGQNGHRVVESEPLLFAFLRPRHGFGHGERTVVANMGKQPVEKLQNHARTLVSPQRICYACQWQLDPPRFAMIARRLPLLLPLLLALSCWVCGKPSCGRKYSALCFACALRNRTGAGG